MSNTTGFRTIRFREPLFRRKLYISRKPYFIERDRKSGEQDLERLVDTAKSEGCWLFNVQSSTWYNLVEMGDGVGVKALALDLSQFGEVSHYHTHPKFVEEMYRRELKSDDQSQRESDIARNYVAIEIATPSNPDIISYSEIVQKCPNHPIDFRIASPHGVITLESDEAINPNIASEKYKKVFDMEKRMKIAAFTANPKSAISKFIKRMNQHMQGIFTASMEYRVGE